MEAELSGSKEIRFLIFFRLVIALNSSKDNSFILLDIPAGEHELKLIYRPQSFYFALFVFGISFLALLIFLPFFFRRKLM